MSEVKDPNATTLDPALRSMLEIEQPDDKDFIYCAACSNVITQCRTRITVNGSHDHHFTNPHGFEFHVGCFSEALGCDISGTPEAADTWFMHHFWQLASCASCHVHLGWYFTRPQTATYFYGLILDAIQEES